MRRRPTSSSRTTPTHPVLDDTLSLLVSRPNVIITSHQAFLTEEALADIARTTYANLDEYFSGSPTLTNEICYHCPQRKENPQCRARARSGVFSIQFG